MLTGSFIDDLQDIIDGEPAPTVRHASRPETTFPCESCGGTGIYRGVRVHQTDTKCFACKGKGYFKTSYADRMKARASASARKASVKELEQNAFREANPGLIERLTADASWSGFAGSMVQAFNQWNGLTDRQVEASLRVIAQIDAKRAEKQVAREANAGEVDTTKIEAMFQTAKDHGLNKLAFIAGGLKISPAKETSRNAGALYVKKDGVYQGKIASGRFYPGYDADKATLGTLREIAVNPSEASRDYGKKTGVCCCCGRELTDPVSVAAGIGPICASNWGL